MRLGIIGIVLSLTAFSAFAQVQVNVPATGVVPPQVPKNIIAAGRGAGKDVDKDGNITKKVFMEHSEEFFNDIDANHDGVLDSSELYGAYNEVKGPLPGLPKPGQPTAAPAQTPGSGQAVAPLGGIAPVNAGQAVRK